MCTYLHYHAPYPHNMPATRCNVHTTRALLGFCIRIRILYQTPVPRLLDLVHI